VVVTNPSNTWLGLRKQQVKMDGHIIVKALSSQSLKGTPRVYDLKH
jgi:hypothetical protein